MVFSITKNGHSVAVACLAEFRKKNRNLNCNGYMQPEILPSLLTHGEDFNAFFDVNNCQLHCIRCSSFFWDKHKDKAVENMLKHDQLPCVRLEDNVYGKRIRRFINGPIRLRWFMSRR
jgi:hypothetical protein